jgi:lipopolysaccharide/colanic/teichoic acid biosynthesis glycosyltransferase
LKGTLDRTIALFGLILLSPVLATVMLAVWLYDRHSPVYVAQRAGRFGVPFRMVKIRSMAVRADQMGGNSTPSDDNRITPVGFFIRRFKIDELSQLWNVLVGDMSLVGPRPQVLEETETYSPAERALLTVKPGITDFASIVFADEGDILQGASDAYGQYRRLIRPWKSRLGLFYVDKSSPKLDLQLIILTLIRIVSRERALAGVAAVLVDLGASEDLVDVSRRDKPLQPTVWDRADRSLGD